MLTSVAPHRAPRSSKPPNASRRLGLSQAFERCFLSCRLRAMSVPILRLNLPRRAQSPSFLGCASQRESQRERLEDRSPAEKYGLKARADCLSRAEPLNTYGLFESLAYHDLYSQESDSRAT